MQQRNIEKRLQSATTKVQVTKIFMTFLSNMMFGTTRGGFWLPFVFFFIVTAVGFGQVTVSGKKGLLMIPTAEVLEDGTFSLMGAYIPEKQRFGGRPGYNNQIIAGSLTVLPRLSVHFQFIHDRPTGNLPVRPQGLGDRQLDFTYLMVKEKDWRPSVALAATFPISKFAPTSSTALVATKHWEVMSDWQIQGTLGYGVPVYFYRDESNLNNYNFLTKVRLGRKDRDDYLVGGFGGLKVSYRHHAGLMAEWTGQQFHVGAYATVAKRLTLQGGRLSAGAWMASVSYQTPLVKSK